MRLTIFLCRLYSALMGLQSARDIQILHTDLGKPELLISGRAFTYLQKLSVTAQTFVSLSDDYPFAQAVVVIEK